MLQRNSYAHEGVEREQKCNPYKSNYYLCCFYYLRMKVNKISKLCNVSRQAVEKVLKRYDSDAYKAELQNRKHQNHKSQKLKRNILMQVSRRVPCKKSERILFYAGLGYTRQEIASKMGISQQEVILEYKKASSTWPEKFLAFNSFERSLFAKYKKVLSSLKFDSELEELREKICQIKKKLSLYQIERIYAENALKLSRVGKLRLNSDEIMHLDANYTNTIHQMTLVCDIYNKKYFNLLKNNITRCANARVRDCLYSYIYEELLEPLLPGEIPDTGVCSVKKESGRYRQVDIDTNKTIDWETVSSIDNKMSRGMVRSESMRRGREGGSAKDRVAYQMLL